MKLKIGLVGLPNVGKSSLFYLLTNKQVAIENYPFTTIDPNIGTMLYLDPRQMELAQYQNSEKNSPINIEIIDIAGLIKNASQGTGLGKTFLSHIKSADLIFHVIRCFKDEKINHVDESVNPIRDYKTITIELIINDLEQVKKRISKLSRATKEEEQKEKKLLESIENHLSNEKNIRELNLNNKEIRLITPHNFLTQKQMLIIPNYKEEKKDLMEFLEFIKKNNLHFFSIQIMEETIKKMLLEENVETNNSKNINNLPMLIKQINNTLNLKIFFTSGPKETKSWLAQKEWEAFRCAGLIHSDIEKKCCGVEVYNYEDWKKDKNINSLKKTKKIRKEGKNYIIQEGDICNFLF